jgi:aspartate/methionine/tyrosine aminotransferase
VAGGPTSRAPSSAAVAWSRISSNAVRDNPQAAERTRHRPRPRGSASNVRIGSDGARHRYRPAPSRRTGHPSGAGGDAANSYLPFQGHWPLRQAVAEHVGRIAGISYDPRRQCLSVAGGLNGITNTLLSIVEPGQEVVVFDPIYAGLINRIRLAGGVPRHVPSRPTALGWRTDPAELAAAVGPQTAAVLLMGPAMPTGALLTAGHLHALAPALHAHDTWLIYDAAMERLRFDGRPPLHPASHADLTQRVITVGSASKELRMIG